MKNIIKATIALGAAALLSVGCIQETYPTGSTQTKDQVSAQPSAIDGLLNSVPAAMVTTGTAGYQSSYSVHWDFGIGSIHLMTEFMLEDVATLGDNPYYNRYYAWCLNQYQGNAYIYCAYFWTCYYNWIKGCNDVISLVDPDTTLEDSQSQLGQALAYRAAFYLDLARLYLPKENQYVTIPDNIKGLTVPIISETTSEKDANNNPRASREDMYAFILGDLAQAEKLLSDKSLSYKTPNLGVVYGLMARAYLEMGAEGDEGAYENAYKYAEMAINASGKTPLTKSEWQDSSNGFNSGSSNNSWMWGLSCTSENFNNICTLAAMISCEGQWGYAPLSQLGINKATYEKISNKDWRKASWLDENANANGPLAGSATDGEDFLKGTSENPAAKPFESIKFRPAQGNCTNYTVGNAMDVLLMRVEEMWFIEMEALAGQGKLAEAKALLKKFMDQRYSDSSYSTDNLGDNESFIDEMFFQKRVEFWGEGILIYDYKRLDKGITRGYTGTNHPSVWTFNCEGRSPQWNIVITRAETQSNTAVVNNPDPSQFTKNWTE